MAKIRAEYRGSRDSESFDVYLDDRHCIDVSISKNVLTGFIGVPMVNWSAHGDQDVETTRVYARALMFAANDLAETLKIIFQDHDETCRQVIEIVAMPDGTYENIHGVLFRQHGIDGEPHKWWQYKRKDMKEFENFDEAYYKVKIVTEYQRKDYTCAVD